MPDKSCDCNLNSSVYRKGSIPESSKEVIAFLFFKFFPSFYELFIHCHVGYSSWDTLADGLEAVTSASNNIPGEEDSSFDDANCTFNGPLDEAFSGLVDNFPSPFRKHFKEYIGISEKVNRPQHLIHFLCELLHIEIC